MQGGISMEIAYCIMFTHMMNSATLHSDAQGGINSMFEHDAVFMWINVTETNAALSHVVQSGTFCALNTLYANHCLAS